MTQAKQIEAGEIIALSSGEYSDYRIGAFSKVLKPINEEVWQLMGESCRGNYQWDKEYFEEGKAVPWLVANGYIEEIAYTELHLGDYGRLSPWSDA